MRRMCRGLEYDICEMAFTTYLCARAAGLPFTAVPVFVTRNFHHWAISINATFEPAYMALASIYESQQDRANAIAVYRKYLQVVNPHSKEGRQHLVRLYLYDKSYKEALSELEKVLMDNPDDLDAQLRFVQLEGGVGVDDAQLLRTGAQLLSVE